MNEIIAITTIAPYITKGNKYHIIDYVQPNDIIMIGIISDVGEEYIVEPVYFRFVDSYYSVIDSIELTLGKCYNVLPFSEDEFMVRADTGEWVQFPISYFKTQHQIRIDKLKEIAK